MLPLFNSISILDTNEDILPPSQVTLDKIKATTIHQMWSNELDSLKSAYLEYKEERERLMLGEEKQKKKVIKKVVKTTKVIVEE